MKGSCTGSYIAILNIQKPLVNTTYMWGPKATEILEERGSKTSILTSFVRSVASKQEIILNCFSRFETELFAFFPTCDDDVKHFGGGTRKFSFAQITPDDVTARQTGVRLFASPEVTWQRRNASTLTSSTFSRPNFSWACGMTSERKAVNDFSKLFVIPISSLFEEKEALCRKAKNI